MHLLSLLIIASICAARPVVVPWSSLYLPSYNLTSEETLAIKYMWDAFVAEFGHLPITKTFHTFESNIIAMWEHNQMPSNFTMGINQFTGMSPSEYRQYLGYRQELKGSSSLSRYVFRRMALNAPLPKHVDWREKGRVTPVKDQGHCGSCWAFSAIGAIEGQYERASHSLISLSEQQLVDCSGSFGNMGCNGGFMDNAFRYVIKAGGVDSEKDYPYVSGVTGEPNDACTFKPNISYGKVHGLVDVRSGNEEDLMEALALNGPISIAINAGLTSFMMYHEGIYDDPDCVGDMEDLNHGVLLVGYGTDNGVPYWLVKNSWGTKWGEQGYVRIKRTGNLCGVATAASYPLI